MKLINFIICDDIRLEVGGKHTIVGLYDDAINFNVPIAEKGKWPKGMKLGIFVRARFEDEKEKEAIDSFRLDVSFNDKKKTIAAGKLNFQEQKEAKGVNLAAVFEQFAFECAGLLKMKIVLLNNKNEEVTALECPDAIVISEILV